MKKESYEEFAKRVNSLIDSKMITSDEYRLLWRAYEDKLRKAAIARAKYKVGDRITLGGFGNNIEITEIGASETNTWGEYEPYYRGRKIDRYGRYTKTQCKASFSQRRVKPFEPKPLPESKK